MIILNNKSNNKSHYKILATYKYFTLRYISKFILIAYDYFSTRENP